MPGGDLRTYLDRSEMHHDTEVAKSICTKSKEIQVYNRRHVNRPFGFPGPGLGCNTDIEGRKMMRTGAPRRASLRPSCYMVISLLLALCANACSSRKNTGSMKSFTQSGKQTLIQVADKNGHTWSLLSVDAASITAYLVMNSNNQVDLVASAFTDKAGAQHAVVFVDSGEKEEALAILDRKFLMGVANSTGAYRKWAEQKVVFTYGGVQETRRIDLKKGGLGAGNIRVDGGKIVAQIAQANCHCYDAALACVGLPSPIIACINKICDVINCTINVINGSASDCNQEGADAKTTCELAVAEPQ